MFEKPQQTNRRLLFRILLILVLTANIAFLIYRYPEELSALRQPLLLRLSPLLPTHWVDQATQPSEPGFRTSANDLFIAINAIRVKAEVTEYVSDETSCEMAQVLSQRAPTESQDFIKDCEECAKAAVVRISNAAPAARLLEEIHADASAHDLVLGDEFSHVCITEKENELVLFFARYLSHSISSTQSNSDASLPAQAVVQRPTATPKNFTEDQLWQALAEYRRAHKRSDLKMDENLCTYARKRVGQHLELMATTPKEEYPNQDKYPLDSHAGFQHDGDTGELFDIAKRNLVAENLAYWPTAEYPHHVIEWGWDTSTEGHREAQLSNEYTHACLSGDQGFYVAIFGK